jgi:hypothetical protein
MTGEFSKDDQYDVMEWIAGFLESSITPFCNDVDIPGCYCVREPGGGRELTEEGGDHLTVNRRHSADDVMPGVRRWKRTAGRQIQWVSLIFFPSFCAAHQLVNLLLDPNHSRYRACRVMRVKSSSWTVVEEIQEEVGFFLSFPIFSFLDVII